MAGHWVWSNSGVRREEGVGVVVMGKPSQVVFTAAATYGASLVQAEAIAHVELLIWVTPSMSEQFQLLSPRMFHIQYYVCKYINI